MKARSPPLSLLVAALVSTGTTTVVQGFAVVSSRSTVAKTWTTTTTTKTTTTTTALTVGLTGWDNDDFLDSLGRAGGPPQGDSNSNDDDGDEYDEVPLPPTDADLPGGDIVGAQLTDEMKARVKASHEDDEQASSQGGQMFRKLLERAKEQQGGRHPPPIPPMPPPMPVMPQTAAAPPQMPADFNNLSVEEQARLFREMMAQQTAPLPPPPMNPYAQQAPPQPYPGQPQPNPYAQQQQQGAYPPPTAPPSKGNYLGPGIAPDGRKIGRNKDADAIVNSADLYFAQLKRDSTTRNYARYAGDDEAANNVFHHPSIAQIKMHVNPYLQEQKANQEKDMLETVPEEMLIFQDYSNHRARGQPADFAGISYKEKLAQRRAQRSGGAAKDAAKGTQNLPTVPRATPAVSPVGETTAVDGEAGSPPQAAAAAVDAPVGVPESPPREAVPVETADALTGDTRQDIRTLMGLLLKHRGGPGFGAGRLQGSEAERLEALAKAIPQVLQQEEEQQQQAASIPQENVAVVAQSVPTLPGASPGGAVTSMIACIEGAVTMYKNSPEELLGSLLVTLRAALLSALDTLSQAIDGEASAANIPAGLGTPTRPASLTPAQSQSVQGMIGYIEGAITMYKNSPAELQANVLETLRVALLSAVNTCNEILVAPLPPSAGAPPQMAIPVAEATPFAAATVVDVSPVVEAPPEPEPAAPQYSGNDANSQMLQEIYERVQNAGGPGKMGLKPDLSADEASDLQDALADMRTLLVDELHSGIPENNEASDETGEAPLAEEDDETAAAPSSTASKYKQMLEKARAEKEAKDNDFQ